MATNFYAHKKHARSTHVILNVTRITDHAAVVPAEWPTPTPSQMNLNRPPAFRRKFPQTVEDALQAFGQDICEQCGVKARRHTDPQSAACYAAWLAAIDFDDRTDIEIRGPHPTMGYTVWTRRLMPLEENKIIGQYLGKIRPCPTDRNSYIYPLTRGNGVIDGEFTCNWARYVNSSCTPNLVVQGTMVGKRNVIVLRTRERIAENQQLTSAYGAKWFRDMNMLCRCGTPAVPHPGIDVAVHERNR